MDVDTWPGFKGHPRALRTLFFTEMWERFSFYGMRALLILYMAAPIAAGGLGLDAASASAVYGLYTGMVYFTAIPGGWIADRLLGLKRSVLVGGILIALGHYSMAANRLPLFYAGLVLIVLGTGLLKPNISSIVGTLYAKDDTRRDAGFSLFYMGINLGAFIAPLVCGFLAQHPYFKVLLAGVGLHPEHTWHWGFGAAAIGMTFGVIQYVWSWHRLAHVERAEEPMREPLVGWAIVLASLAALGAVLWIAWDLRYYVMLAAAVAFFAWLLAQTRGREERARTWALILLFVFSVLFWGAFEQAGSSLNLFADQRTSRTLLGFDFPASWLQSVNSIFIVALAPVLAWLWIRLGRREPSSPAKFALGLLFVGLGFLPVAWGAHLSEQAGGAPASAWWLIAVYFFHTLGELCLSPVGLSTVTKLAPARLVGSMMGVWFLSLSIGNFVGGAVSGYFEKLPLPQLFGAVAGTTLVAAVVLAVLVPTIKRLMSGVR